MKAVDVATGDIVETKIGDVWTRVRVVGNVMLPRGGGCVQNAWAQDRTVEGFYVEPCGGGRQRPRKASELRPMRKAKVTT